MGRQAWKNGAFLTVSLLSAAFFGRLERISRTVYLKPKGRACPGNGDRKESPETAVEIIETETEQKQKSRQEAGKRPAGSVSDPRTDILRTLLMRKCGSFAKKEGDSLEKREEKPLERGGTFSFL